MPARLAPPPPPPPSPPPPPPLLPPPSPSRRRVRRPRIHTLRPGALPDMLHGCVRGVPPEGQPQNRTCTACDGALYGSAIIDQWGRCTADQLAPLTTEDALFELGNVRFSFLWTLVIGVSAAAACCCLILVCVICRQRRRAVSGAARLRQKKRPYLLRFSTIVGKDFDQFIARARVEPAADVAQRVVGAAPIPHRSAPPPPNRLDAHRPAPHRPAPNRPAPHRPAPSPPAMPLPHRQPPPPPAVAPRLTSLAKRLPPPRDGGSPINLTKRKPPPPPSDLLLSSPLQRALREMHTPMATQRGEVRSRSSPPKRGMSEHEALEQLQLSALAFNLATLPDVKCTYRAAPSLPHDPADTYRAAPSLPAACEPSAEQGETSSLTKRLPPPTNRLLRPKRAPPSCEASSSWAVQRRWLTEEEDDTERL